jgi:hypothetical protein
VSLFSLRHRPPQCRANRPTARAPIPHGARTGPEGWMGAGEAGGRAPAFEAKRARPHQHGAQ